MSEKRKCFIITPIGGENAPIRRHIDGIIDAAIIPVLDTQFDITVAHRINSTGSINKQVIESIYSADLVVANLTEKNPNVMYELAFRHCLGTPVITIAETGTSLPFDIGSERTIFYTNDAKGVLDLREALSSFLDGISFEQKASPIFDALSDITTTNRLLEIAEQKSPDDVDAIKYIIEQLKSIENRMERFTSPSNPRRRILTIEFHSTPEQADLNAIHEELAILFINSGISLYDVLIDLKSGKVRIFYMGDMALNIRTAPDLLMQISDIFEKYGFGIASFPLPQAPRPT